ncbi:MAG TPA: hypothetical protein VH328_12020, partial [Burkholderiaceae bacterium]|nr:hypothetical protein [Burkholderiaceae bacterium]
MPAEPLSIAQVSPHAWESGHELNRHIAAVSDVLAERGHRVLVVAPSQSQRLVRETRSAIRKGEPLYAADG